MTNEATRSSEAESTSGFTRRNALKAGVAAGVGVVAWSGASITSMGGTPAFATPGCTGVIHLDLSGGCRNTDQASNCDAGAAYRFHQLNAVTSPFSLENNPSEGTCCDSATPPILHWTTTGITCEVHIEFWSGGQSKCENSTGTLENSQTATGSNGTTGVTLPVSCFPVDSNTFYKIFANCATTGSNPGCL